MWEARHLVLWVYVKGRRPHPKQKCGFILKGVDPTPNKNVAGKTCCVVGLFERAEAPLQTKMWVYLKGLRPRPKQKFCRCTEVVYYTYLLVMPIPCP
jgi:hypothetical protein